MGCKLLAKSVQANQTEKGSSKKDSSKKDNYTDTPPSRGQHNGCKGHGRTQRHEGRDEEILKLRKAVYQQAKSKNPNRWSGEIRNGDKVEAVYLNPENQKIEIEEKNCNKFTTCGDN